MFFNTSDSAKTLTLLCFQSFFNRLLFYKTAQQRCYVLQNRCALPYFQHLPIRPASIELEMRSSRLQPSHRGCSPPQGVHNSSEALTNAQLGKRPKFDGGSVDKDNVLTQNSPHLIPPSGGFKSSDHTDISGFYTDTCPDARRAPPQSAADQVGFRV